MEIKSKRITIISLIYVHLYPVFLLLSLEYMNYFENKTLFARALNALPVFLLTCLAIYLVMVMLYMVFGNIFISGILITGLLYIFYAVNYYRKLITSWVFVPLDLSYITQVKTISDFADMKIDIRIVRPAIVIFILLSLLFIASFIINKRFKIAWKKRLCLLGAVIVFSWGLFFTTISQRYILPLFDVDVRRTYTSNQAYDKNGAIMGFYIVYTYYEKVQQPNGYSEKYINAIVDNIKSSVNDSVDDAGKKPNVICILSEAFSDPTLLNGITFSEDPIPNYRRLQSEGASGRLIVPAFSGGTANVEFEFLTGMANIYTGHGKTPYNEPSFYFGDKRLMALPNIYKANGYQTVALHTFKGDFYNRNELYPKLGFDKFVAAEDMPDAEIKGLYISDEYFTDKLIQLFEEKDEDKPIFMFGITMENHYEYFTGKFSSFEPSNILAESELLSESQKGSVNSYAYGLNDADKQLQRLVDYLSSCDEPTILVFFGDHLPSLGDSALDVYKTINYINSSDNINWSVDEFRNMYTTTYVVWNNFGKEYTDLGDISAYFLGNEVLNMSEVDKTLYFHFLDTAYTKFNGLIENLFADKDDNYYYNPTAAAIKATSDMQTIEYDLFYGNEYSVESLNTIP